MLGKNSKIDKESHFRIRPDPCFKNTRNQGHHFVHNTEHSVNVE